MDEKIVAKVKEIIDMRHPKDEQSRGVQENILYGHIRIMFRLRTFPSDHELILEYLDEAYLDK